MFVLTRTPGTSVRIGDSIRITILRVKGNSIRIGIEAPREVPVLRIDTDFVEITQPVPKTIPRDPWARFVPRSHRSAQKRRRAQAIRRAKMAAKLQVNPLCNCGQRLRVVTDSAECRQWPPDMAMMLDGEVCCPECRNERSPGAMARPA